MLVSVYDFKRTSQLSDPSQRVHAKRTNEPTMK